MRSQHVQAHPSDGRGCEQQRKQRLSKKLGNPLRAALEHCSLPAMFVQQRRHRAYGLFNVLRQRRRNRLLGDAEP
jgi:hypothetical protein